MFMVAGAQTEALVKDFQGAVAKAIEKGTTLDEFRKDFDKIVQTHGWQYNGTRGWRSKLIFETNLSTAYSAGRYAKLTAPDTLKQYPGWRYNHSGAKHPRLEHKSWDGNTWPAKDPIWGKIFPPNGYGCGCFVTPVSFRAIEVKGGYDSVPDLDQVGTDQPRGVDPSFAYNPGAAWLARTAPGPKAVTASQVQIANFVKAALRGKWPDGSWTPVGVARGEVAEKLQVAAKTEIRLSASTIRSHTHHDKITADGYATLPKWLLTNGELVEDANGRLSFVGEFEGKDYQAAIKVVAKEDHDEVYLISLRRAEKRKTKKLKRK
ncbi:phage head morphogenesis protein [Rhizobium sp. C1]|nr:phage head morphogenesis protein [Rhizobium sp. C1]